jgi:hypothetical protein
MSPKGLNAAWRAAAKQHYGPWVDVALLNNYVPTAFRKYVERQLFPIPALLGDLPCQGSPFVKTPPLLLLAKPAKFSPQLVLFSSPTNFYAL